MPYAEVIGDPIAHSKSPLIHRHWLEMLGIDGDYRATHVRPGDLRSHLADRRGEADWRGCNVTIPHKQAIIDLIDDLSPEAEAVGAVNCVVATDGGLLGYNSDVDGIAAALDGVPIERKPVVVIGAGGAARAMCAYLAARSPARVTLLARNVAKAVELKTSASDITVSALDSAPKVLAGAALIVNASPLGMRASSSMPEDLLVAVENNAEGAALFDMVYNPLETHFLRRGAKAGGRAIDGLTMLIGQARRAFTLFFGVQPPAGDSDLRQILEEKPSERTQ